MPRPTDIKLHQKSHTLEIAFDDGSRFNLPCEYLRVYSPSAEVRGHGPGEMKTETGKESVNITNIEPVGNYAVKLVFDDGHDTGLYSWDTLHDLGVNYERYWQDYIRRLEQVGYQRQGPEPQTEAQSHSGGGSDELGVGKWRPH